MPKHKKRPMAPVIEEEVKIAVTMAIKQFKLDDTSKEHSFPSSLTNEQRAFVHQVAIESHLKSKSRGKGPSRFVTVFKPEGSTIMQDDATMGISPMSINEISTLVQRCPVTTKERQEIMPYIDRDNTDLRRMDPSLLIRNGVSGRMEVSKMRETTRMLGRLNSGVPGIPPVPTPPPHLVKVRDDLPIASMREEVVNLINGNQVVIISGETGSGKTTQVPQFILEHCHANSKSCRIICAQPRRISAVSVSERVAAERGEELGYIVGYQIRLESKISPRSLLTYCTYGVLLRSLMVGDAALSTTTHVIVDEVHERDRHCDFLLLVLRDMLARCRGLRVILMSATLDTTLLTGYFRGAAVMSVPGRLYEVNEFFLEDVLRETGYTNKKMQNYSFDCEKREGQKVGLEQWKQGKSVTPKQAKNSEPMPPPPPPVDIHQPERIHLSKWLTDDIDETMEDAWYSGNNEAFEKLLHILRSQNVSLDHPHSATSATILMIAAARNKTDLVERLLEFGARPDIKACNDFTALDWAVECGNHEVAEILNSYIMAQASESSAGENPSLSAQLNYEISEEDRKLLESYQSSINDEHVDLNLVMCLINQIHASKSEGAILVFLPGYDDIVDLHDRIKEDKNLHSQGPFRVFLLHSNMQTNDQRQVFKPLPPSERKIILSTNIAETSITIDDVVYVIDAGKVKEKSFDALVGVCMLRSMWISRACAQQRRGRAGRTQPGLCYHLFSRKRHQAMQPYQTPEILRLPLQELCLQTKMLAPFNTSIADFLAKAPEPPPNIVTRNAVNLLKLMDALTPCEDLTDLGQHLIDLPIEPRFGKALLFAIVLRCLDPVLTIICTLAYKEPFNLPSMPSLRYMASESKRKLSAGTYSDHMSLLRAFQLWQESRSKNRGRRFCEENFVSAATLEMVMALRSQLLGQLRASGFVRTRGGSDMHELNMNSDNWAVIKAALTAGLYPNLARIDRSAYRLRTQNEAKVQFHTSSVLRQGNSSSTNRSVAEAHAALLKELPSDWILFEEMSRVGHFCHIRTCTVVSPITVFLFAGSSHMAYDPQFDGEEDEARCQLAQELESDSEAEDTPTGSTTLLKLDDWANFRLPPDKARMAVQLRQKLHSLFIRRLRGPGKPPTQGDDHVLRCVVNVLTAEEKALMLPQPLGIGQKPRTFEIGNSRNFNMNDSGNLDRQAKLLSPLEACMTRSSDTSSNMSSDSPCLSPTLSNDGSGSSGDLYPQTKDSPIRYFVIKNGNLHSIEEATTTLRWTFSNQTLKKLNRAQREGKTVVMIFSVQRSGGFQGYARLGRDDMAGNPTVRSIEWLKIGDVPFQACRHLLNPWHDNQRVQNSRDGQELETNVGESLCQLWERLPNKRQFQYPPPPTCLPMPQFSNMQPPMMDPNTSHMQQQYGRPIRGSYGFSGHNGAYSPNSNGHMHHHPGNLHPRENIRAEAIRETGLASDQILLVHGGVALEDKNKLNSYGIKPGVMIHVLKKKEKDAPIPRKTMTEKEIQQLALAFRTFALNPGFRSTLNRLSRPDTMENIVMAIPGLSQDAIALSIIRDPELLVNMSDIATIKRALDKHPVLAEAANYIAAAVHEETITARHTRRGEATPASSSAFSPDVFSGGEEMDSSQSSDSPTARSSSSSMGGSFGITSSQLEAALAAAVGSGPAGASTSGAASSSRSSGQDRSGFITPEMFNSALQQAFQGITGPAFSSSSSASSTPRGPPAADGPLALAERMSQQLQQMRELGLRDQVFNLQALQITNGDVQAAIELVMSSGNNGRDEDDDDDNSFN